ncbi:hypothetical protein [Mycolicibacterium thermoresistibile]
MTLLAVVGVTVAVTASVVGGDNNETSTAPTQSVNGANAGASDIASANDNGPVTIITEEPTCAPLRPIMTALSDAQKNGWDKRDPSIPATAWTTEMRQQYEEVGKVMRDSADKFVTISRITPHRVIRELYGQISVYMRAYADAIPNYVATDDNLVRVSTSAAGVVSNICSSIDYGSAAARAPFAKPSAAPEQVAPVGDLESPQPFLSERNTVCEDWATAISDFQRDAAPWGATSPDIPVGQWSPEQKALNDEVVPVMKRFANQLLSLGSLSGNPILRDFAELSARYRFTYVEAIPTYMPADKYLANVAMLSSGVVNAACKALAT